MTGPESPIAAVTHPDPYPFYADLVRSRPFERDESLGLWVAASAEAVSAVLASDLGRVRPAAEPVPRALIGSPAGEIFGRLVRMNDGAGHDALKDAVTATLAPVDAARLDAASQASARALWRDVDRGAFAFHLPVHVVASLLGVPRSRLRET